MTTPCESSFSPLITNIISIEWPPIDSFKTWTPTLCPEHRNLLSLPIHPFVRISLTFAGMMTALTVTDWAPWSACALLLIFFIIVIKEHRHRHSHSYTRDRFSHDSTSDNDQTKSGRLAHAPTLYTPHHITTVDGGGLSFTWMASTWSSCVVLAINNRGTPL